MWPLLAFAPLSPGRIGVQICAIGVVAAIGALTARCAPPSATAGRHDPRAVRTAVAAIAAGAVLYLACSAALDLALAGAAGWPLFALPAGILVSALGCLLWAFGFARRALSEQVEAHLEKTMDALRTEGAPPEAAEPLVRQRDESPEPSPSWCVAGCVLYVAGAVLCLAVPGGTFSLAQPDALACCVASLAAAAACLVGLALIPRHAQSELDARKAEIDRKADVTQARIIASEAKQKAAEATRVAKIANQLISESDTASGLENACLAAAKKFELSQREVDVLTQLAHGRSRPRIAENLSLSLSTVNSHVHNIYQKMQVHKNQELIDVLESLK